MFQYLATFCVVVVLRGRCVAATVWPSSCVWVQVSARGRTRGERERELSQPPHPNPQANLLLTRQSLAAALTVRQKTCELQTPQHGEKEHVDYPHPEKTTREQVRRMRAWAEWLSKRSVVEVLRSWAEFS